MTRSQSTLRRTLVAILAALALFATACGGGSDAALAAGSQDVDAAPAEAAAPSVADDVEAAAEPAISLVASTITGDQIDFASLAGDDVVLWFWAPW